MGTFNYKASQSRASGLLKKFGRDMTVSMYDTVSDPVEGTNTFANITTATVSGVELPASEGLRQKFQSAYTSDLERGSVEFLLISSKGVDFEVKAGGLITKDGNSFELLGATPLRPIGATVTLLYWVMITPTTRVLV